MSINAQLEIAGVLDAHHNFVSDGRTTHCNTYAAVFLGLRGHVVPITMSANELYDWFASPAAVGKGWRRATKVEALDEANRGGDAICIRKDEPHGHVAVCVASLPNTPGRLCVSAAGATNFVRAPIERSFGPMRAADAFYVNLGG